MFLVIGEVFRLPINLEGAGYMRPISKSWIE